MKYLKFLIIGILFGIVMTKSEAISWFRIQEMFRFQSFHMYGIIGTAITFGLIITQLFKRGIIKNYRGEIVQFQNKNFSIPRYLYGGILFGLGWALSGACPGPMYVLIGNGISIFILIILSAVFGTYVYGLVRDKLPH